MMVIVYTPIKIFLPLDLYSLIKTAFPFYIAAYIHLSNITI